jgi:hypothetical protein
VPGYSIYCNARVEFVRVIVCCVLGKLVSDAMRRLYISKGYFVRVVESRGVSLYVSYEFKVFVLQRMLIWTLGGLATDRLVASCG